MRKIIGLAAAAAALLAVGSVRAQGFERVASEATTLYDAAEIAAVFWSHTTSCDEIQNDMHRRQCEGVKAARRSRTADTVFRVSASPSVLELGAYDAVSRSSALTIRACVACEQSISQERDERLYVVGNGETTVRSGSVVAPTLASTKRKFSSESKAQEWRQDVLPRLRTEILFRMGAGEISPVVSSGVGTLPVEVVGYRVYDPCDGQVIAANPRSQSVAAEKQSCSGSGSKLAAKPANHDEPVDPSLPVELTSHELAKVLAPMSKAGNHCHDRFGVTGQAKIHMVILGSGKLTEVELHGDFKGTPTGKCLLHALKRVKFPKSQKQRTQMLYPVSVR